MAWVCGHSPVGIAGSNPAGVKEVPCDCLGLSDRGLWDRPITRPEECSTESDMSDCDLETSTVRRPRQAKVVEP